VVRAIADPADASHMFHTLARGLLDLLAPPECPACALDWSPADGAASFCPACAPLLELPPDQLRPPADDAAATVFQGPAADAIRRFKYAGNRSAAPCLATLLVDAAVGYAGAIDAVVPMPLHPSKLRGRGWNPSVLLAKPVAAALAVPLRTRWLSRQRATRDQAGLSRKARLHNVLGAFTAREVPPQRVLLIDDVRTTGATLAEAAKTLRARDHHVVTLALAWAPGDLGE
jgi:predicted amidophosphoribosyltransferase